MSVLYGMELCIVSHTAEEGCMRILCRMELYVVCIQQKRAVRIMCGMKLYVVSMQLERAV